MVRPRVPGAIPAACGMPFPGAEMALETRWSRSVEAKVISGLESRPEGVSGRSTNFQQLTRSVNNLGIFSSATESLFTRQGAMLRG